MAWRALLAAFAPVLEVLLRQLGATFNANQAAKRAEQTAQDLGEAKAKLDTANATIDAQQRELEAQANAPQTVDDALKRLEEGSA